MENENKTIVYVYVNENGEIQTAQTGERLVPSEPWHYFFLTDEATAADVYEHKVEIWDMVPKLIRKS